VLALDALLVLAIKGVATLKRFVRWNRREGPG